MGSGGGSGGRPEGSGGFESRRLDYFSSREAPGSRPMAPAGSAEPGSALSKAGAAPPPLGAWRPFPSACCCCFSALLGVNSWLFFYGFLYLALYAQVSQSKSCDKISCFSGHCVNSTCVCDQGWVGDQCQHCQGRFK